LIKRRLHELIKSDSKYIYVDSNQLCSFKDPDKKFMVSTKILGNTTVLNNDNKKKCFLSAKSAY